MIKLIIKKIKINKYKSSKYIHYSFFLLNKTKSFIKSRQTDKIFNLFGKNIKNNYQKKFKLILKFLNKIIRKPKKIKLTLANKKYDNYLKKILIF